jgi:hypothetical protein
MKNAQDLRTIIQKIARELAAEIDLSGFEAKTLFPYLWRTFKDLDNLKSHVIDPGFEKLAEPATRTNPQLLKAVADTLRAGVQIYAVILGIQHALICELDRRSQRNRTNFYFGLLKVGHDLGDKELQKEALRHLGGILMSIPYKRSWVHSPEGAQGWLGVINEALVEQLKKIEKLDLATVLLRMAENGFYYVYQAVQARLIDEVRRLTRMPITVKLGDHQSVFEDMPAPEQTWEQQMQRRDVIGVAKALAGLSEPGSWRQEILVLLSESLQNRKLNQFDLDSGKVRALFVTMLADKRGVSARQASKDMNKFKALVLTDPDIRKLADEIRAIVPPKTEKVVLKLKELEGTQGNNPEEVALRVKSQRKGSPGIVEPTKEGPLDE